MLFIHLFIIYEIGVYVFSGWMHKSLHRGPRALNFEAEVDTPS